jgi:two-component system cell cycle response regulator
MPNSQLQAENQALRQQLETLLREARANELKMRRFDELEHRLIGAASLSELFNVLLFEYRQAFGLESVTLSLVDADQELSQILELELREQGSLSNLNLLPSMQTLREIYGATLRPYLGAFDRRLHAELFKGDTRGIASMALLPLSRHGELIGSLHFGAKDVQRYDSASGTNFLERLAGVIAVCLDSALNQERLKLAGLTDMLTGVHNRRYFEDRCVIEVTQARRYEHSLACMFLDIDHFKQINDRHGHAAGDTVLRGVGALIKAQLRAGDTIARIGGEEFVVLLPRANALQSREIAERIRQRIAAQTFSAKADQTVKITISIGLAMLQKEPAGTPPPAIAERLVAAADGALYQAKHSGRDRVVSAE